MPECSRLGNDLNEMIERQRQFEEDRAIRRATLRTARLWTWGILVVAGLVGWWLL